MTANDPSRQQETVMVMLSYLDKATVRIRNQGPVDFDVFDQRECALLYRLEERPRAV